MQVGERKPQAGPFREAVRRAGYEHGDSVGGEWVHVGDDWASDCVGAKTMRMRAVLVRVPGKPKLGDTLDVRGISYRVCAVLLSNAVDLVRNSSCARSIFWGCFRRW